MMLSRAELIALLAAAALAAVVTGAWAMAGRPQYEAEVSLIARASPLGDAQAPAVQAALFTPLLTSTASAEEVMTRLQLGQSPGELSASRFVRDAVRVNVVGGTPVILVRVRLHDPELAARAANELASVAVEQAREINQREATDARDRLRGLYDEARRRYDEAQAALTTLRRESNIDLLKTDAQAVLAERAKALTVSLDLAAERARLAQIDQEAAARSRVDTLKRSIDRDPALMAAAGQASGTTPLGLSLSEESISKVYEAVDEERAEARATVAALTERLAGQRRRGVAGDSSKPLHALYEAERAIADRELDVAIARTAFQEAAAEFESARLHVETRSAGLALLAPARPADEPLGNRAVLQAGLAFALVFGGLFAALQVRRHLAA